MRIAEACLVASVCLGCMGAVAEAAQSAEGAIDVVLGRPRHPGGRSFTEDLQRIQKKLGTSDGEIRTILHSTVRSGFSSDDRLRQFQAEAAMSALVHYGDASSVEVLEPFVRVDDHLGSLAVMVYTILSGCRMTSPLRGILDPASAYSHRHRMMVYNAFRQGYHAAKSSGDFREADRIRLVLEGFAKADKKNAGWLESTFSEKEADVQQGRSSLEADKAPDNAQKPGSEWLFPVVSVAVGVLLAAVAGSWLYIHRRTRSKTQEPT